MGKRWTIKEDVAVISFYFSNKNDINDLYNLVWDIDSTRSKNTIKCRLSNYRYLDGKRGFSHYSKQQKELFERYKYKKTH